MTVTISPTQVKELRERTGAGMMECRKALVETNGDMDKAIRALRERGILKAQTKAGREAADGRVEGHLSEDARIGALVEVNCETDFVAKTDEFKGLSAALARQVAVQPPTIDSTGVERNPERLLEAGYLGDPGKTVKEAVQECIARLGENIVVRRFARFEGELVETYIHAVGGGKIGTMVELAVGSPAGARHPAVKGLARNLAMQVAAAHPTYARRAEVPASVLDEEKRIYRAQAEGEGKPAQVLDKIAEGKLVKFYQTVCLLEQPYIKEQNRPVSDVIREAAGQAGTSIDVKRFVRFALGEKES